jgi:hypothetical protein
MMIIRVVRWFDIEAGIHDNKLTVAKYKVYVTFAVRDGRIILK